MLQVWNSRVIIFSGQWMIVKIDVALVVLAVIYVFAVPILETWLAEGERALGGGWRTTTMGADITAK
jgi:hypothetical protein